MRLRLRPRLLPQAEPCKASNLRQLLPTPKLSRKHLLWPLQSLLPKLLSPLTLLNPSLQKHPQTLGPKPSRLASRPFFPRKKSLC